MSLRIATLLCIYRHDHPEYCRTAIQSVLDQQLAAGIDSRLYLGIDGPISDALNAVVEEYRQRTFAIHRSDENEGLASTLNYLLRMLDDEMFIFRMDADDESLPSRYQRQLDYMADHPQVDILGTAITEVDEALGRERVVTFCRNPKDAIANLHWRVPVAHPTVLFRRRVFDIVQEYPATGTNEDVALWFVCARNGLVFDNLSDSLLRFRISPSFWRRRGVAKAKSEMLCYFRGIYMLHGLLTLRYAMPLARFLLRISPVFVSRWAYQSIFRSA